MKFADTHVNKGKRFSLGREMESGRFYLSIPVSNRLVDYEEYYEISREAHDGYPENVEILTKFADECRAHRCDHLILVNPGKDRGVG
jgi:hypothetical protein